MNKVPDRSREFIASIGEKVATFETNLGFGNGFMLPAGPLREPKSAVNRADAVMVVKNEKTKKNFKLPLGIPVFFVENKTVSPYRKNERLFAFAGIGYPKKFFNSLTGVVGTRAFADHYQYTDADLEKLVKLADKKKAKLVTTEKDWVRLPEKYQEKIKYATLETVIDEKFFDWLKEKLDANNKKVS